MTEGPCLECAHHQGICPRCKERLALRAEVAALRERDTKLTAERNRLAFECGTLGGELAALREERDGFQRECDHYLASATKARRELAEARAEVAALACRVERLAMDLGRSEAREAEARALLDEAADNEAEIGCGCMFTEPEKCWMCRTRAFLRGDKERTDEAAESAVQHPVGIGGVARVLPRRAGADGEALGRDEARRCEHEWRIADSVIWQCQKCHLTSNTDPARDEARRCTCGHWFTQNGEHYETCPASDEAPGGD